jgi:hypothetical protein
VVYQRANRNNAGKPLGELVGRRLDPTRRSALRMNRPLSLADLAELEEMLMRAASAPGIRGPGPPLRLAVHRLQPARS